MPIDDDVREEDCALCAQWPAGLRPAMREAIDSVPLSKPVCDRCEEAFWVNVVRLQVERSGDALLHQPGKGLDRPVKR